MNDKDMLHNIKNNGEVGLIPATKILLRNAAQRRKETEDINAEERKQWLLRLAVPRKL